MGYLEHRFHTKYKNLSNTFHIDSHKNLNSFKVISLSANLTTKYMEVLNYKTAVKTIILWQ